MRYIDDLIKRKTKLEPIKSEIENAVISLEECYKSGNKVLICGSGGSASDSAHIAGELMKSFCKKRLIDPKLDLDKDLLENLEAGLPTIDITAFNSLNTAFSNDRSFEYAYANAVLGLGKKDDTLIAISTSGNSKSVYNAVRVAKAKGMKVLVLTGKDGGLLKNIGDIVIKSTESETFLIQEDHESIYHSICLQIEDDIF